MSETESDRPSNVDTRLLEQQILARLGRLEHTLESLGTRGGGSSGDGMGPWQQSVENRLGQLDAHLLDVRREIAGLRTDTRADITDLRGDVGRLRSEMGMQFRWLLGVLVAVFGALLAVMAQGFGWI